MAQIQLRAQLCAGTAPKLMQPAVTGRSTTGQALPRGINGGDALIRFGARDMPQDPPARCARQISCRACSGLLDLAFHSALER